MTTVPTMTVGPGRLTIGTTGTLAEASALVRACSVVPSVSQDDATPVLSGDTAPGARTETWTLEGTVSQDLGAPGSFAEFCFANRGQILPFEYVPNRGAGKAWRGNVTVEAMTSGGEVGAVATADFTWTIVGEPTLGDATVTPAGLTPLTVKA